METIKSYKYTGEEESVFIPLKTYREMVRAEEQVAILKTLLKSFAYTTDFTTLAKAILCVQEETDHA